MIAETHNPDLRRSTTASNPFHEYYDEQSETPPVDSRAPKLHSVGITTTVRGTTAPELARFISEDPIGLNALEVRGRQFP